MSPLGGTVEATLLTLPRVARNGPALALEVVVAAAVLAAVVAAAVLAVVDELEELVGLAGAAAAGNGQRYACEGKD